MNTIELIIVVFGCSFSIFLIYHEGRVIDYMLKYKWKCPICGEKEVVVDKEFRDDDGYVIYRTYKCLGCE